MRLTIDRQAEGRVTARFDFGPVDSNPTVPEGAFELTGAIAATGRNAFALELVAVRWIHQPTGYFMVGVSLETAGPRALRGTIHHPTCGELVARRVG